MRAGANPGWRFQFRCRGSRPRVPFGRRVISPSLLIIFILRRSSFVFALEAETTKLPCPPDRKGMTRSHLDA